jgi:hypothetical protein
MGQSAWGERRSWKRFCLGWAIWLLTVLALGAFISYGTSHRAASKVDKGYPVETRQGSGLMHIPR